MKKAVHLSLAFCLVLMLASGCSEGTSTPGDTHPADSAGTPATPETKVTPGSVSAMLQGKWQHVEDASNFIVFEGNHRKEIADGMTEWDDTEIVIADQCKNAGDSRYASAAERDRYISDLKNDMCWYIISVDADNLQLSYVSRGNTLTYKRVK